MVNSLSLPLTKHLNSLNFTLAVAETCTGGVIADVLTDKAGASAFFMGAVVAYSYASLQDLMKVNPETLAIHGAVSEATVREMAQNVRLLYSADIGIALCGITGPGGGSLQKPVGTTWLAISANNKDIPVATHHAQFKGPRKKIKAQMAQFSLEKLADFLNGLNSPA